MADSVPSSARLYQTRQEIHDEIAGYPSQERDTDLIIRHPGSHQFLGHDANHHDGQSTLGPRGNTVQAGRMPTAKSAPVGDPTPVKPGGYPDRSLTT